MAPGASSSTSIPRTASSRSTSWPRLLRDAAGPLQVQVDGLAERRTDALFDHLDRDKDGQLTRPELASIAGSLRRLDLDDNELIGADEVAPFESPTAASSR